jgi:peptide/nickel transport system permease protein
VTLPSSAEPFVVDVPREAAGRPLLARERRALLASLISIALIVIAAALAPVIAPYSPTAQDFTSTLQAPSSTHLFGTDQFGRDVFSRVLYAARIDLLIAMSIVGIAFIIGTTIGAIAGYLGGVVDNISMRVVDTALAFPFLILVIAIVATRGPGVANLVFAASTVWWVSYARLVRGEALAIRALPYMAAARASGFSSMRCILRHLLPNVVVQPLVYASSDIIYALLLASSVSFLGLGVQPPTPEWGQMIADAQNFITTAWWMAFFPGLALVVTGVAFAFLGDTGVRVLGGAEAESA